MLAEVVEHGAEIGRGVVELVDRAVRRRLDDEARPAEHAHAVVPALEAVVVRARAVRRRPIDVGDGVDGLQSGKRNDRFHGGGASCSAGLCINRANAESEGPFLP